MIEGAHCPLGVDDPYVDLFAGNVLHGDHQVVGRSHEGSSVGRIQIPCDDDDKFGRESQEVGRYPVGAGPVAVISWRIVLLSTTGHRMSAV